MNSLIGRNRQGGVTGNGGGGDDEGGGSGSNRDEDQESAAGNDGDDNGGGGGNGGDDNAPSNADNAAGDVPEQGTPDSTPSQNASGPDANDEAPAKKPAGRWGSWTGTSNSGTRLNYSMSDSGNTNQSGRNGNAGDNSPQAQQTEKFRSDFDSGDFDLVKDKWNLSSNPRRAFVQYMEERKNMGEAAYAQMIRDAKNPPPKS